MRAAILHEPRSVTSGDRPDPAILEPTDVIVRVAIARVCGLDLWHYGVDERRAIKSPLRIGAL